MAAGIFVETVKSTRGTYTNVSSVNDGTYHLVYSDAICPNCKSKSKLFCPKVFIADKPAYYLCFNCGMVGKVGVGPV